MSLENATIRSQVGQHLKDLVRNGDSAVNELQRAEVVRTTTCNFYRHNYIIKT